MGISNALIGIREDSKQVIILQQSKYELVFLFQILAVCFIDPNSMAHNHEKHKKESALQRRQQSKRNR